MVTGELQERAGETIMQATMVGRATAALYFLVLTIVGGAWMASAVSAEEAKKDWTITGAIGVRTLSTVTATFSAQFAA